MQQVGATSRKKHSSVCPVKRSVNLRKILLLEADYQTSLCPRSTVKEKSPKKSYFDAVKLHTAPGSAPGSVHLRVLHPY